jgi:hypothetical protein
MNAFYAEEVALDGIFHTDATDRDSIAGDAATNRTRTKSQWLLPRQIRLLFLPKGGLRISFVVGGSSSSSPLGNSVIFPREDQLRVF